MDEGISFAIILSKLERKRKNSYISMERSTKIILLTFSTNSWCQCLEFQACLFFERKWNSPSPSHPNTNASFPGSHPLHTDTNFKFQDPQSFACIYMWKGQLISLQLKSTGTRKRRFLPNKTSWFEDVISSFHLDEESVLRTIIYSHSQVSKIGSLNFGWGNSKKF